jgi:hypothetical protein
MSINYPPQNWREKILRFWYGPAWRDYMKWRAQKK